MIADLFIIQDAHCMFVKGFILTEVAETTDSSQAGSIPEEWFKLAGWATKDYSEPNEEFWRTHAPLFYSDHHQKGYLEESFSATDSIARTF